MLKTVLEKAYAWGTRLDRAFTKPTRLPTFVVSVGNLAVGGRAKTPLVIDLIRFFQKEGYEPVVLTRGYGRKSKVAVEVGPSTQVEEAGDEPFEIYLRTQAKVLVGSQRTENALRYLKKNSSSKNVFILDDGFQHWALERDLDIVLIKDQDLSDRLLPVGRLRESSAALKRADLVLNLDKDCHKKTSLSTKEIVFSREQTMAITTRAGSQDRYFEDLSQIIGFPLQRKEFQDHLSGEVLRKELLKLNAEIKVLILGMKEAVKLFSAEELLHHDLIHQKDFLNLNLSGRAFQVCLSKLDLEWDRSKFKALCEQKLKGFQT